MRFFFLIIFLAGLALGIAYPWAVRNFSGYEIGTYEVYARDDGSTSAEVALAPSEAPVRVALEMRTSEPFVAEAQITALTVVATAGDRTVFAVPVSFANAESRSAGPQGGMIYRADVAVIDPVDGDDDYVFVVEPGQAADLSIERAELILNAGAFDLDSRAVPVGYILIVVGLVGFIAMWQRRRVINRKKAAEDPRWGRGAGTEE